MKRCRFTQEQIIGGLRERQAGMSAAELRRKRRISNATFCNWRLKNGGMEVSEAKWLTQIEDENAQLKRLVAGQMMEF